MKLKVAVLLGGTSAERDVSLVTGREISKALFQKGHDVTAIDCAYGTQTISDWEVDSTDVIHVNYSDIENQKSELDHNILKTTNYLLKEKFDVVFNALHGGYGENGQLQALLELLNIPYTGSDSLASGLGMDKNLSKIIFQQNKIPTASWIKLDDKMSIEDIQVQEFGYPLVIKPNNQGSTVGLTIVENQKSIDKAIELGFKHSKSVLIEKFIPGRELTVSILGNQALPVIEIIPEHGIYDYECKYQKGKSQYIVPANISTEITNKIQKYAVAAYQAIGCRHYARIDFRMTPEKELYCLEVNTLPGMTPTSLVPKAAAAMGLDFATLIEKIILMTMEKK